MKMEIVICFKERLCILVLSLGRNVFFIKEVLLCCICSLDNEGCSYFKNRKL